VTVTVTAATPPTSSTAKVIDQAYEIRDAILMCARKPTSVSLIYRTEPTTKKCKNGKTKKVIKNEHVICHVGRQTQQNKQAAHKNTVSQKTRHQSDAHNFTKY